MTKHHAIEIPTGGDAPLANFSQCHSGILSQLDAFAELPALQAAAVQSRQVAASTLALFQRVVFAHHADEESELFPAMLSSAEPGVEGDYVRLVTERLIAEHRELESRWKKLEPVIKAAAAGKGASLDGAAVGELVQAYRAHANFEEQQFLRLAQTILARNSDHMAELGLSLHLRHTPQVVGHL